MVVAASFLWLVVEFQHRSVQIMGVGRMTVQFQSPGDVPARRGEIAAIQCVPRLDDLTLIRLITHGRCLVRGRQPTPENLGHGGPELYRFERFGQKIDDSELHRLDRVLRRTMRGHHQHGGFNVVRTDVGKQRQTALHPKSQVEDQKVVVTLLHLGAGFRNRTGGIHVVAIGL